MSHQYCEPNSYKKWAKDWIFVGIFASIFIYYLKCGVEKNGVTLFVWPEELEKVAETHKCTKCSRIFQSSSSKNRRDRLTCKFREIPDVRPKQSRDIGSNDDEQSLLPNDLDIEMTLDENWEDLYVRSERSQLLDDFQMMPEWCDDSVLPDKHQQSDTGSIINDFGSFSDLSIIANDEPATIESEV